ncbi:unnamed protein product, partial [marine sediment metagenome]
FPQGNPNHANPNLEESYEKIHYSVIHGGTEYFNEIDNVGSRSGTNLYQGTDIA